MKKQTLTTSDCKISTVFLLILLWTIPKTLMADSASDEYKLAAGLYNQKRYELAAESFRKYIEKNPKGEHVADAYYYYGLSLYRGDQYQKAHSAFEAVVKKYPEYEKLSDAYYRLAETSYFEDDYPNAEKEFSQFLKKYPENQLASFAYPYLGDIQLRQKKFKQAAESFKKSIDLFPDGSMLEDSRFGLAKAYTGLKQYQDAIGLYEQLEKSELGERQADALFHLATLHFDQKDYQKAAEAYSKLDQEYPENSLASLSRMNAGYAFYKLGKYEEAITFFEKAAKSDDQQIRANYWIGLAYKAMSQYEKAAETFDKMIAMQLPDSFAEKIYYYRADSEHRAGLYDQSQEHFLEYVEKWPANQSADDSLYFAAEAALEQNELDLAKRLIAKMEKDYPNSSLVMHQHLLKGRIYSASARLEKEDSQKSKADYATSLREFQYVYLKSQTPRTRNLARYYAGQTFRDVDNPKSSQAVLKPVVDEIIKQDKDSEFIEALSLQARNALDMKEYEKVIELTDLFLKLSPENPKRDLVYSSRAIAAAYLKQFEEAVKSVEQLEKLNPNSPYLLQSEYTVAEEAYDNEKWSEAEKLFSKVIEAGKGNKLYATSISGLAWSAYKQKNFEKSRDLFRQIAEEFQADKDLGPEASFMYAQSLQDNQELEKSAEAYLASFNRYAPKSGAQSQEKDQPDYSKNPYVYRAGLQAARVYRMQNKVSESDQAYDSLMKSYPDAENKDLLYDEWALLNYEAENFDRADEIFRLLVRYCPESELVDNAKLSLAQSDYLNGKSKEAYETFKSLYEDEKSDSRVKEVSLHNLIVINIGMSQWKIVSDLAEKFLREYPESSYNSEVKFYEAESLLHLDEYKKSFEILTQLEEEARETDNRTLWQKRIPLLLAELHFHNKDYEESVKLVSGLREKYPNLSTLYQGDEILGRCYKQQAKFDLARKHFQIAIDDPEGKGTETAAKSQFMLGECYMMEKNYENALREYLKVYHLYEYPRWQAIGLFQAAQCDEAQNNWKNAVQSYEDILAKFPNSEIAKKANERLQVARTRVIR